ncbi:MAG TPA: glycosyltransferase [Nitriliruptorales bacterium]|nr:glycosyltransferase [Nitriliruptorales bacterium]
MNRLVFVTTELAALTPGGAGRLVASVAERLRAAGQPATVVVVLDEDADALTTGHPEDVVVVRAVSGAPTPFLARAQAAAEAVATLSRRHPLSRVEFTDFDGLGFVTLARRDALGLQRVALTVRLHGPVDLMAEAMGVAHDEWAHVRVMERHVFRMADAVVVPSPPFVDLVAHRYGTEPDRIVVGEPPVDLPPAAPLRPARSPEFVALGRLGEVKGSHDLVDATLRVMDEGRDLTVRLLGADGWSITARRPMRDWLRERVPTRHRDRIRFEQPVNRSDLAAAIASAWAVVIPSRFESFCLAAHEARGLGHALAVRDLPAFRPYFGAATGALVCDDTVDGLADALRRLSDQPDLVARLAAAPPPAYADPLDAYDRAVTPRHPRAQAGLATTALKHLEAVVAAPTPVSRLGAVATGLLRHLPEPAARAAVHVLPAGVKDRFRRYASWPEERERRASEARRAQLHRRVAAGNFPHLDEPQVTVVVPCHDQGRFLDDAIRSVFEQTFTSWEIVVVDDGSTDPDTRATLDRLAWPRTRVLRQGNRGLPAARNAGIRAARGRCVVPLDADDQLEDGFLEELRDALEARPDAGYAHCWARLFGDLDAVYASRPFNPYQQLLSNGVVGCVLLRRDAWAAVDGYAEDMTQGNEDWDLWLRLLADGWGQVQVRAPLFRYRKHGVSMSVETEARFEDAQARMPARHPALYARRALRERKAAFYPWVSVIVSARSDLPELARQTLDDVEIVARGPVEGADRLATGRGWTCRQAGAELAPAVRTARGKFLIDWDAVRTAGSDLLQALAAVLEEHDDAVGAVPSGRSQEHTLLWRRWVLLDPHAPHRGTVSALAEADTASAVPLSPGATPDPEWMAPPAGDGAPVQRQPPEELGTFPEHLVATGPAT